MSDLLKRRPLSALVISAVFICLMMMFPSLCSDGVRKGTQCCFEMLIPSLFPFMVASSFLMRSGGSELAGRLTGAPLCAVSYLPRTCAAALILSFTGGFPVGARCISVLYSNGCITREQAQRMSLYCVCAGPAFLITAVGSAMLHNAAAGAVLYLSQLISGFILCAAVGIYARIRKKPLAPAKQKVRDIPPLTDCFIEAVGDGTRAAVSMCALVLLFSAAMSLIEGTGAAGAVSAALRGAGIPSYLSDSILPFITEVSTGTKVLRESGAPLWVFSAAVGFGGFCVHFQVFSILSELKINKPLYLLFRAANAVISSAVTAILCMLSDDAVPTAAILSGYEFEPARYNITGGLALIAACFLFVLTIRNKSGKILKQ